LHPVGACPREDDLAVVGEAAPGHDALRLVRRVRPDVLLLDVRMPGMDGLATLRAVAAEPELAGLRVIVVTTFEIDRYIFEALQAGAAGFVLKDTAPADLVRQQVRGLPPSVGANPAGKVATTVAGMVAGADCIDDLDVVRHGGMPALFGGVYAPSTLGSFCTATPEESPPGQLTHRVPGRCPRGGARCPWTAPL
jgi:CheY-like chemotaxis protein